MRYLTYRELCPGDLVMGVQLVTCVLSIDIDHGDVAVTWCDSDTLFVRTMTYNEYDCVMTMRWAKHVFRDGVDVMVYG